MGNDGNTYIIPKATPTPIEQQPYRPQFNESDVNIIALFRDHKLVRDAFPCADLSHFDKKTLDKIIKMKPEEFKKLMKVCPGYEDKMTSAAVMAGMPRTVYASYDTVMTPVGAKDNVVKSEIPGTDIYRPLANINNDRAYAGLQKIDDKDYLRIVFADKNKIDAFLKSLETKNQEPSGPRKSLQESRDFCWPRKE